MRTRNKFLIAAGALVALVVVAAVLAPMLVDVNRYRGLIQTRAEEAIGRRVTLGEMSLTILPTFGIDVRDPEIEGLLKARSVTIGVRLLPLLFGGSIEVRKVILERPEMTATRSADGRWNFQDLGSGAAGATRPSGAEGEAAADGRAFSLGRLDIREGIVRLRAVRPGSREPLSVDLQVRLAGSVSRTAGGDLDAAFDGTLLGEGIDLKLSGQLESRGSSIALDADIGRAAVELPRARELAEGIGAGWPLPDGLLVSRDLKARGRARIRLDAGSLAGLALSDVVVEDLSARLARDRAGRWNFDPLIAGGGGGGGRPERAAGPEISLTRISVSNAVLDLSDESMVGAGAGRPVELKLTGLNLKLEDLAPGKPLALRLTAGTEPGGGTILIEGTVPSSLEPGGAPAAIDTRFALERIDVQSVAPYLENLLDLPGRSGRVSLSGTARGEWPARLGLKGKIALDAVSVEGARQPITAQADFDVTLSDGAARAQIGTLKMAFGASTVSVSGTVDNRRAGATLVDLEIPPAEVAGRDLEALLAIAGVPLPVEFSSARPVRLEARVKGDVKSSAALDISGSARVEDATFRHESMAKPMERVRGRIGISRDAFEVTDFSGVIGESDIAGTLSVAGLDAPRVTFALASRRADFWELMSFLREDEGGGTGGGGARPTSSPEDDYLEKITARGTLTIGEGSFGNLAFRDLSSTLSLERKVARLDPVRMNLYGGSMEGKASIDMNRDPAVYTVEARPSGIDTNALLTANLQMKDALAGALSGSLAISASGADLDAVLANARGSGRVELVDGRVGAINVLKVLSKASGVLGEQSLKQLSDRLARQGTAFSRLSADLKVGGGKISTDNLVMTSPDLDLKDDGSLDMLAGTLSISGEIIFSESVSQAMVNEKSRAAEIFWDDRKGRVALPLALSGPIASPTPNIDWGSAGGKLAQRKVKEKLIGRMQEAGLGNLVEDRAGKAPVRQPPVSPAGPATEPAPPAGAGDLMIVIEEKEFTGNFLVPDLKLKGELRGTAIVDASVEVKSEDGRVLHRESLAERVAKYYASNDSAAPAAIRFRIEVDGKKLIPAKKRVEVFVTVRDADGNQTTQTVKVRQ